MANQEQLKILKQDVYRWNDWREENPDLVIDLSGADLGKAFLLRVNLSGADLSGADFIRAHLNSANLSGANLKGANLAEADLRESDLSRADLGKANLWETDLKRANLRKADLSEANLWEADLNRAKLGEANLGGANLSEVNLSGANLKGSKFMDARAYNTFFGGLDLSETIGLADINHSGPSTIGTDTIAKSKGKVPEAFLRGCGLSDWEIEQAKLYNPELSNDEITQIQERVYGLRASQALQISPLFISYSHADGAFVDKLENLLNKKGVRFWRDVHDMKAGRMEKQIGRAIRQNLTVLLVLSEHSLSSDWVEHEVRTARKLEKKLGHDTLCPIALDDSWKRARWPERVMEQIMEYNILDFSAWEDDSKFDDMFRKLIDGLKLFY